MVYSVFYYASEAITRAVVGLILKIYDLLQRRQIIEKKPKKKRPSWGFFETTNPYGTKEYVWVSRATNLKVVIPSLIRLPVTAYRGKPPTRLYFTFAEAASKNWFKEIEWLAEQAEKKEE